MRGHEEASGTKYVPPHLFEEWAKKDPVENFENYLLKEQIITSATKDKIRQGIKKEIEAGLKIAFEEEPITPDTAEEVADLFYPFDQKVITPATDKKSNKRFIDAISDSLHQNMERHDKPDPHGTRHRRVWWGIQNHRRICWEIWERSRAQYASMRICDHRCQL